MAKFASWLVGKKTYILAGAVVLVTLVLVALGKLTPQTACAVLLFAVAGFSVTFRAALQSHQKDVVAILTQIAVAGAAVAAHNPKAAVAASEAAALDGAQLGAAIQQDAKGGIQLVPGDKS